MKFTKLQLIRNMVFSVLAFVLNLLLNFFITPYITEQFGSEAYGYVKMANDFASYASLLSIALNSMASRYIMLYRVRGEVEKANKYYSSIAVANVVLGFILTLPSAICVIYLDKILSISHSLVFDAKMTFLFTFINFIMGVFFSIYGNCYYLSNRLDINSAKTAQSNILKIVFIFIFFYFFSPHISFIALGTLLSTMYISLYNVYYAKKLLPDMKFSMANFEVKKVKEILAAGMWNSITKLSQILTSGLDLLITNLLVGPIMMGYLSIAKTVPTLIVSFNATIANVFSPNLMHLYAKGDMNELKKSAKLAIHFMCMFVAIPNAVLITMGKEFFELWVPGQPAELINILSILTVINSCITGPLQPLYQIFTITNKIKQSSTVMIIYGISSITVTYIFLKFTSLGVFAVAGVSMIGSIIVALIYHLPFSAIYIGAPWYEFFPEIGKSILSLLSICLVGFGVNGVLELSTSPVIWSIGAVITCIGGAVINYFLILKREERVILLGMVKKLFRKGEA